MVFTKETKLKRVIIARLEKGEDILKTLEKIAKNHSITSGQLTLIGAVQGIKLGYFDVEENSYTHFEVDEDLEVVSCIGNIATLDDGSLIVHAHMIASDRNGRCYGGHLMEGCRVSATIEVYILEVEENIYRGRDELTGLNLLQLDK